MTVALLIPIMLLLILRLHGVQTYLASQAAQLASEELQRPVFIGSLKFNYRLSFIADNLFIGDTNNNKIFYADHLELKIKTLNKKKRKLKISRLLLEGNSLRIARNNVDSTFNIPLTTQSKGAGEKSWNIELEKLLIKNSSLEYIDPLAQDIPIGNNHFDAGHLLISGFNSNIENISFSKDSINLFINDLSLNLNDNFSIKKLKTNVIKTDEHIAVNDFLFITENSQIKIPDEVLLLLENKKLSNIEFKGRFDGCYIYPPDFEAFHPLLSSIDKDISIEGFIEGQTDNFRLRGFYMQFGNNTSFTGSADINGLPDIKETFIKLNIKKFQTISEDLSLISLIDKNINLQSPFANIEKLGNISLSGSFTGFYNDFVSEALLSTNIGSIETDLSVKHNREKRKNLYQGRLRANSLDLGSIIGKSNIAGQVSFDTYLSGETYENGKINLHIAGLVDSITVKGINYNDIILAGDVVNKKFKGKLKMQDELAYMDFDGFLDFNTRQPTADFRLELRDAYLDLLNLSSRGPETKISANMKLRLEGFERGFPLGYLHIDSLSYFENDVLYSVDDFFLLSEVDSLGSNHFLLESDFADASLSSNKNISQIKNRLSGILHNFLPSVFPSSPAGEEAINIRGELEIKNTEALSRLFLPGSAFVPHTKLNFSIEDTILNTRMTSSSVTYAGIEYQNLKINGYRLDSSFKMDAFCQNIIFRKPGDETRDSLMLGIEGVKFSTSLSNDTIVNEFSWNDFQEKDHNKGKIKSIISLSEYPGITAVIDTNNILINDTSWRIEKGNRFIYDTNFFAVRKFRIKGGSQLMEASGVLSKHPDSALSIFFDKVNISNFDLILNNKGVDLNGIINGDLDIKSTGEHPYMLSNLRINDFEFNQEGLGDAIIQSKWIDSLQSLIASGEVLYHGNERISKTLDFEGHYTPNNEEKIKIDINLYNYSLKTLEPFMKKFMTHFKGYASGKLTFKDENQKRSLSGDVNLRRAQFGIDFTKSDYISNDHVIFDEDFIGFDNMAFYDTLGNQGILNGKIYHTFFKDFSYDLKISPKSMMALNTGFQDNKRFYGDIFASGSLILKGEGKNIDLIANAKTEKNTKVYIPITTTAELSDKQFIRFINSTDSPEATQEYIQDMSGVGFQVEADIGPEAEIWLFLPSDIGNVYANGEGIIRAEIDKTGELSIFGDYRMQKGTFLFTIQNLFSKNFSIREGGSISWNGDPYEAYLNLVAAHRIRATLKGLPILNADSSLLTKRIPIDCIIQLNGNINDPDIKFNIELPDAEQEVKELVYNSIDTTNDIEMNQQMISLLILNSFSFTTRYNSLASSFGSNSFDILSNQISNWLSQISKDFDIGVNYRPGDELSSEELEVALSTQLFNDRVLINGNFAVAGTEDYDKTSNIVGDVYVEVKITRDGRIKIKAFNKSNTIDLLNDNAPYTQGVGVFYRKEFDRLRDLFKKKKTNDGKLNK